MDPVEIKDFCFRRLRRVQVFGGSEVAGIAGLKHPISGYRLLSSSNHFGIVFCISPTSKKLFAFPSKEIHKLTAKKENANIPVNLTELENVKTVDFSNDSDQSPSFIECSSDGLTLAVGIHKSSTPFVSFFDVRCFAPQVNEPVYSFGEVRVSTQPGAELTDFQWNPIQTDTFCASASDGSLMVGKVDVTTGNVSLLASKLSQPIPTTLCWSPKGKQVIVGRNDGSLEQYTPALVSTRIIPAPSSASQITTETNITGPFTCVNVLWVSTWQYAIVYTPVGSQRTLSLCVVSVKKEKEALPSWRILEDVCYSQGQVLPPKYIMHHITPWNLLICSSTISQETGLVGSVDNSSDASTWFQWDLDESGRAELPSIPGHTTGLDPHCLGATVDFTSKTQVPISDMQLAGPMPILLLLSTDGFIFPYHIHNEMAIYKGVGDSLLRDPSSNSVLQGIRRGKPPQPNTKVTTQGDQQQHPPTLFGSKPTRITPDRTPSALAGSLGAQLNKNQSGVTRANPPLVPQTTVPTPGEQSINPGLSSKPKPKSQNVYRVPNNVLVESDLTQLNSLPAHQFGQEASGGNDAKSSPVIQKLREYVAEERRKFEGDLTRLNNCLKQPLPSVGTREELVKLSEQRFQIEQKAEELKQRSEGLGEGQRWLLEWVMAGMMSGEETQIMAKHRDAPEYVHLLRLKPLDPVQNKKIHQLQARLKSTTEETEKLQSRVRAIAQRSRLPKQRPIQFRSLASKNESATSTELIRRTIENMQEIITEQTKRLNAVKLNGERSRDAPQSSYTKSWFSPNTRNVSISSLSQSLERTRIAAEVLDRSMTGQVRGDQVQKDEIPSPTRLPSQANMLTSPTEDRRLQFLRDKANRLSGEKMDKLRNLLETRHTTPHKTTVPKLPTPTFKWPSKTEESVDRQQEEKEVTNSAKQIIQQQVNFKAGPKSVVNPIKHRDQQQNFGLGFPVTKPMVPPQEPKPTSQPSDLQKPVALFGGLASGFSNTVSSAPAKQSAGAAPSMFSSSKTETVVPTKLTQEPPKPTPTIGGGGLFGTSGGGLILAGSSKPALNPSSNLGFSFTPKPATTAPSTVTTFGTTEPSPESTEPQGILGATKPQSNPIPLALSDAKKNAPFPSTLSKQPPQPETYTTPEENKDSPVEGIFPQATSTPAFSFKPTSKPSNVPQPPPPKFQLPSSAADTDGSRDEDDSSVLRAKSETDEPRKEPAALVPALDRKEAVVVPPKVSHDSPPPSPPSTPKMDKPGVEPQSNTTGVPSSATPLIPVIPLPTTTTTTSAFSTTTLTLPTPTPTTTTSTAAVGGGTPSTITPSAPAGGGDLVDDNGMEEMLEEEPAPPAPAPSSAFGGFSFAQPQPQTGIPAPKASGSIFGGGGDLFGNNLSGLGGKPSEEAARKNVFGGGLSFNASPSTGTGPTGGGVFGAKSAFGGSSPFSSPQQSQQQPQRTSFGGGFSSPGGSVMGQGFGSFGGGGATAVAGSTAGFGQSPSFGGGGGGFGTKPSFGASSAFGGGGGGAAPASTFGASSAFGGSPPSGGRIFGSTGVAAASPASGGGFAALAQQTGGGGSVFGGTSGFPNAAPAAGSVFGGASGTSPSSFGQWR